MAADIYTWNAGWHIGRQRGPVQPWQAVHRQSIQWLLSFLVPASLALANFTFHACLASAGIFGANGKLPSRIVCMAPDIPGTPGGWMSQPGTQRKHQAAWNAATPLLTERVDSRRSLFQSRMALLRSHEGRQCFTMARRQADSLCLNGFSAAVWARDMRPSTNGCRPRCAPVGCGGIVAPEVKRGLILPAELEGPRTVRNMTERRLEDH